MRTNKLASRFAQESNITQTENGAKTYRSSLNAVLDFFYLAPTRQGQDNTDLFMQAFEENPNLAIKCAFYLRDIRGGKGQRKTFRDILAYLAKNERSIFNSVVPYAPMYGRWDDILPFYKYTAVQKLVVSQLNEDIKSDRPTLLGKWMPSENASSKETRELARAWSKLFVTTPRQYRKILTSLRAKIGVVESQMSAQEWETINYSYVPSRAMKLYRKAFYKHDETRFDSFVHKAITGEVKIQSKTLYPHEIVSEYIHGSGQDNVLEAQWNQLPNYFGDEERNVLIVVDTSSSMFCNIGGKTQAIDVSIALGLYCSERNKGAFHNVIMTFNSSPDIVIVKGKTLSSRVNAVRGIPWGGSTNLQGTFEELLRYAKEEKVPAKDMPTNIIIITDGEFNSQISGRTNFEGIKEQYKKARYTMPLLTFWNVNARNTQVPVTKNEKNVFMVSGFSAETIGKVLNAEATTPEQLMLEVLNSPRYAFVDEIL